MPFIKANDASTTLKRDLEGKVALKMEEECECSDPAKCQKKQAEKMTNYKKYDMGDNVFSSQRNTSLLIGIPGIVPPITGSKTPRRSARSSSFDFSSSTTVYTFSRRMSGSNGSCPRSLLPYSEDTHGTLGTNCRFAKVSQRLLCRLYSPSKTPSFLRPPLPSRWMRCDTNFSNLGFGVDWGFEEKLPSRQRADGRMIRAEKDFRCAWILRA